MQDLVLAAALILTFAIAVTAHVTLFVACWKRLLGGSETPPPSHSRWWTVLLMGCIPPLVPYWGFRLGMKGRVILWLLSVLVYAGARVLCSR